MESHEQDTRGNFLIARKPLDKEVSSSGESGSIRDLLDLLDELGSQPDDPIPHDGSPEKKDATITHTRQAPFVSENDLQTNPAIGLNDIEVVLRRRRFGWNELREEKQSIVKKILSFFVGPIQFVMEAAILLSLILCKWIDGCILIGLLLLNASVGLYQDMRAESIVKDLKKTLCTSCTVVRTFQSQDIDPRELVPGDIVKLEEGTIIPADGSIVSRNTRIQVDQSALTGESLPVSKCKGDMLLQSAIVRRGEGIMIVTATGDRTFLGRAATLTETAAAEAGHFTLIVRSIGLVLLACVIVTLFVVWISAFYRSAPLEEILTYTLVITNIGVPVGLPAVITTTMAVGAAFLAKRKVIVRRLAAIEALAGVEILCSDKTGTLTKNKLSLGEPYIFPRANMNDLIVTACLASSHKRKGLDAIDKACLKCLGSMGPARQFVQCHKILKFTPFDPVSKRVTAIVEHHGEKAVCMKGAPAAIVKKITEQGFEETEALKVLEDRVEDFSNRGYRSVAVARKEGDEPWQLLGILPFLDPPRDDTAATIYEAQRLGLRIKMLTGDAVGIAKETARLLGLGSNILRAENLDKADTGALRISAFGDLVERADGFAEVYPQHKYRVVEMLQLKGFLVAMTGDGVNDAPSLRKADTGIAVEGASPAARSAADIVFLAPGLSAIIDAIKVSRQIFHRMYSYMVYRIALSIHMLVFLGIWIIFFQDHLDPTLVVLLAVFADVSTLAIAYDKARYADRPVTWNLGRVWLIATIEGLFLALSSLLCFTTILPSVDTRWYFQGRQGIIESFGEPHSIMFLEIALTESFLILITREGGWNCYPSWQLLSAIAFVDILATMICRFGLVKQFQPTDGLTVVRIWIFSIGVSCIMAMVHHLISRITQRQRYSPKRTSAIGGSGTP